MDGRTDASADPETLRVDPFPNGLSAGSTVLVANAGDPSRYAVDLRALCQYGQADETAVAVTTTESADRTVETYDRVCSEPDRPSLGIVDTTSERQSVSALYDETPVIFTPSPGDLERLTLALSDLSQNNPPSNGNRHLLVRSLTPVLETTSTTRVCTVLDRITGLRSGDGLCLLGLDYTAHDEGTMNALTERVDGVLWTTQPSPDSVEFEYRQAKGRFGDVPGDGA